MLFLLLGLVYFLAFCPQAVLSFFQLISYSPIQQCGPFSIYFAEGTPPTAPLTLTVLPFNSTSLAFTIPQSAWDNSTASGSHVVFLPLPEGVSLLASLDDASGSAAVTSEVIQIGSSDNTSCISSAAKAASPSTFRLLNTTISQCSPFSVSHNSSFPDYPISVRVLIPTGLSFWLQRTSLYSSQGVDTFAFIMSVARGLQVALLFDDRQGNHQVSDLLSVAGGESTPTNCLQIASSTSTASSRASGLSRSAVIVIAATSTVIVVVILILGVFFVRRERRKLATLRSNPIDTIQNHGQFGERGPTVSSLVPPRHSRMPPYAPIAGVPSDPMGLPVTSSRSSVFSPFVPPSLGVRRSRSNSSRNASIRTKSTIGGPNSRPLVDLDIAGLLEVASVTHRESEMETQSNSSSVTPTSTPAVPPLSLAPSLRANRLTSGWRRSYRDLDMPLRSFSGVSHTRGPSVLAQETRVATPNNHDLPPSRDADLRSRSRTPVPF